ncbi:MAG: hypothetical protein CHACPFDD_03345 [Phycisphaerae bacterium]|nr:hypothetical protein [Phycisphaerae bacterium]
MTTSVALLTTTCTSCVTLPDAPRRLPEPNMVLIIVAVSFGSACFSSIVAMLSCGASMSISFTTACTSSIMDSGARTISRLVRGSGRMLKFWAARLPRDCVTCFLAISVTVCATCCASVNWSVMNTVLIMSLTVRALNLSIMASTSANWLGIAVTIQVSAAAKVVMLTRCSRWLLPALTACSTCRASVSICSPMPGSS